MIRTRLFRGNFDLHHQSLLSFKSLHELNLYRLERFLIKLRNVLAVFRLWIGCETPISHISVLPFDVSITVHPRSGNL